jgi:hypothetical protein
MKKPTMMDVFKDKRPETSLWKMHGNIPFSPLLSGPREKE